MAQSVDEKVAFFRSLETLDNLLECSDDDADDFARMMTLWRHNAMTRSESLASRSPAANLSSLREDSVYLPTVPGGKGKREDCAVDDSGSSDIVTKSTMGSTRQDKASGKRKRSVVLKSVPEQQQIFKGLVFFFFPNSDVSPLRRLRIQRAQEYGALWERKWRDNITHVIVDKGLAFQEVLRHLSLETFPPNVALLDEGYPSECIKFRSVLSTSLVRFRIKGMPVASETKKAIPQVESGEESLPLKPTGKSRQLQTPSQSDESQSDTDLPERQVADDGMYQEHEESLLEPLRERDALDDMIEETKAVKDLPLEPLDSCDEETAAGSDPESSAESDSQTTPRKKRRASKLEDKAEDAWQQKFLCMQKHDSTTYSDNPNGRTIEVLQQMLDYYTRTDDHWRSLAYRKAISALRRQPRKIIFKSQARAIAGIGPRLADKIEEIVLTNRLRRLENTNKTSEDIILQEFMGVYGAGISQASKWLAQGYRSLEDLKSKAPLTQNQRIGVEHYHDFAQRIPRKEVEEHGKIVQRAVQKADPEMQVIISGSYRRGATDSGDIDLLITKPNAGIEQIRTLMIDVVVPKLFKQGFLQVSLASTSRGDGSKWHGASTVPGSHIWRRIDLLFVPGSEIGAALVYFTGNDIFNRSMRLLASKKGMRLNQRGLYTDVIRGPQRAKVNTGRLLEGRDERRIFEILGVPWRPPEHRIC
ncbi:hypothetical protein BDV25DRAFT_172437 [Aspergillus avenaceus]|uniref:DNA polymerase lambda n=1 Tax=Aspergillus avenaceus TaxID=36643 RepID=A0A5N6TUN0_ASPAV|nr:hypothetical protein BDV25DRAFT_172437 [Aspergillus avenaceus]